MLCIIYLGQNDKGDLMKKVFAAIFLALIVFVIVDRIFLDDNPSNQEELTSYESREASAYQDYGPQVGQKAPNFTLQTLSGESFTLEHLQGKKVILNFWATWCPPCKEELPAMQNVYDQYKDQGVEVVAINLTVGKETVENAKQFMEEHGLTLTVPLDESGDVLELYEIMPLPTSYFIDSSGIIRSKYLGPMTEEYMKEELEKLS